MFRNLLKISFRSLVKDKSYSILNVAGLTIGITSSLFLLLYVLDELSFDLYNKNAGNIYRIVSNIKEPDNAFTWSSTQIPLAEELKDNYPEVVNAVRFMGTQKTLFKNGEKRFMEDGFYLADSSAFKMFTHEFIAGNEVTALDQPFSLVLTESVAKKYFENPREAINHSLQTTEGEEFKITGVIKDVPRNSHFRFDGLVSKSTRPKRTGNWGGFGVFTYIQLPPNYDLSKMQASLDKIVKEKVNPVFEEAGVKVKYELQRITDIHLHSKIQDEAESGGDISYIYIFSAVAAFMLIIACINYMNLATARSAKRSREVGIRKVVGGQRKQLILQFLVESVVVAFISLLFSILAIYILLPSFNTLANKAIAFSFLMQPAVMISLVGIILFTGIVGGSYPAFYLSGFNPINVLKGSVSSKGGSLLFRRSLVVIQFALSIFMLVSTLIVFDQLQFLRNKDLGFDKEHMIRIRLTGKDQQDKAKLLSARMKSNPVVEATGMAESSPGEGINKGLFEVEDATGKMTQRGVDLYGADYDYISAMKMTIVAGRDFLREVGSDSANAALVNESMVRRMGWKDPIGRRIENGEFKKVVVGVVKDYHQNSLYDAIEPLMIVHTEDRNNNLFVRIRRGDVHEFIDAIEKSWKEIFPDYPFEYAFLDQDFDSQYKADQKRSQIFTAFSGLTVFIACLGLLGLAAFNTSQRIKEIGIRKVIGASVSGLVMLVSKEFFILVGIGMLVAFPAAWYFTSHWLSNFAYRIVLAGEWSLFVLSTVLAFAITLITVGYHVVKAAYSNPVKALRAE